MSTDIGADEAARILRVTKATLYAYVSRGIVDRRTAVDGRTSLYDREALEQLAACSRRSTPTEQPSIDVRIGSAVTQLHDDAVRYRGHDAAELARTHRFEDVAELLWTGSLGVATPWRVDRPELDRCRRVIEAAGEIDALSALSLLAVTSGAGREDDDAPTAARRIIAIAPTVFGAPQRGDIADRLARAWVGERPPDAITESISRALVLLADHELATSTLAVRVACSVRATPSKAIAAGLDVVSGPLHGAASTAARALLYEAERDGAQAAIRRRLTAGERLPGFGHTVYRRGDPRFAPLLEAVREIPGVTARHEVVADVLAQAGRSIGQLPNIDLALGALLYVGGFAADAPLFAVARIAGWAAHYAEELEERPVRYRGLATVR